MTQTLPSENIRTVRYSGMRLKSPFAQQGVEILNLAQEVFRLTGTMAEMLQKHQSFVDDSYRLLTPIIFWCRAIQAGEVFICWSDNEIVGAVFVQNIKVGASCEINFAATDPGWLSAIFKDVFPCIFQMPPGGLACLSIKTLVDYDDLQKQEIVTGLGFKHMATLPAETLQHTTPTVKLFYQLLNPALFSAGEVVGGNDGVHGESTDRDEQRGSGVELRSGDAVTVDEHDGDAASGLVSVGSDTDG